MENQDEIQLIRQLNQGSERAFNLLYGRYGGKLYNFLLKLSHGDQYLTEEIVQRVFIRVWEKRTSVRPEETFSAFLFTLSRNMLYNEYEHLVVEFIYQEYCSRQERIDDSAEREVELRSLDAYINGVIERLPSSRKTIVKLYHEQHMSIQEIADYLHLAESTVHNQFRSAVRQIKDELLRHKVELIFLLMLI